MTGNHLTEGNANGKKTFIQYSVPLPEHLYKGDEYFCKFAPRIHRDAYLADQGSWQCQLDFLSASGPADGERNKAHKSYAVGCINPMVGNFTALCACEALPERLALTTYMVEYAYIHDDGEGDFHIPQGIKPVVNQICVVIEYAENKSESQVNILNATTQCRMWRLTASLVM